MPIDLSGLFEDDDMSALEDPDIPRVDLVDRAASGVPRFLIAKQAAGVRGLMDPAFVRKLIGKPEPVVKQDGEMVTMSGSPAAVARFIHQAAQRRAEHDTGPVGSVAKETGMADDLDPTTVLAEPEGDAPGLDTQPSSPAWEAVDAATARKWTSILARARGAVALLADREMLEAAAAGNEGDGVQSVDLQDAACAIDYAISVLAPFAVAEQAEAEVGDEMQAVGKALAGFDPAVLDVVESLGHVRKAGRVLSSANEAAIRDAVDKLQKVLASLPQAPTAVETTGEPVTKTEGTPTVTAPTVTASAAEPVEATPAVMKTEGDPGAVVKADAEGKAAMRAVYDAKGNLVGIVDPADITPIEDAGPEPDAPAETAPEPAPAASDTEPAPAAEVGTPADATDDDLTKQAAEPTSPTETGNIADLLKSSITEAVTAALGTYSATREQEVAKQAADLAGVADVLGGLKDRVEKLELQPAEPHVFTNGAVPPQHLLRGQDRGAVPVDVTKAQEMRQRFADSDPAEQNRLADTMQRAAIGHLAAIHGRP